MGLLKIATWALLLTSFCIFASAAMDVKIYTVVERNLSLNGNSGFEVAAETVEKDTAGSLTEDLTITNSKSKGMALVQIMTVYDQTARAFGPEMISRIWMQEALASAKADGANVTGNWTATSGLGDNVTVTSVNVSSPKLKPLGSTVNMASWKVGENMYAGIMSFFDKNTTEKMINSLKISS